MTRLIHLTDLHFGAERGELIAPLQAAILGCDPDFIIISGDLTHRARRGQFRAALRFIEGLRRPFVVVPGNHDVPLYNFALRWLKPFFTWNRVIPAGSGSFAQVGQMRLFGVNSADPSQWRGGILREEELAEIEARLRAPSDGEAGNWLNLLVCHHPLEEPPGFERGETKGAVEGLERLRRAGLDGVLSGHLHHWQLGLGIGPGQPRAMLHIQTGTALCSRMGERDHGFSLIEQEGAGQSLEVTAFVIDEKALAFRPHPPRRFQRMGGLWYLTGGAPEAAPAGAPGTIPAPAPGADPGSAPGTAPA